MSRSTISTSSPALTQGCRILCCVFPFWSVERQRRDRQLAGSDGANPSDERSGQGRRASGERSPQESLDASGVAACRWRHPRTMSRVWVPGPRATEAPGRTPVDAPGHPILVVQASRGVRTVIATCPNGLRDGVRPGMTLVQAKASLVACGDIVEPAGSERVARSRSQREQDGSMRASPPHASYPIGRYLDHAPARGSGGGADGSDRSSACIVVEHDPRRDAEVLRALAARLLMLVPSVASRTASDAEEERANGCDASPDWRTPGEAVLWGDLTGCERILAQRYGGEEPFLAALQQRLQRRGWTVRVAIGPTPGIGWAVARYARCAAGEHPVEDARSVGQHSARIIRPGEEIEAIRNLPIECLRLRREDAAALREVQVERVGQLLDISRSELAERFVGERIGTERRTGTRSAGRRAARIGRAGGHSQRADRRSSEAGSAAISHSGGGTRDGTGRGNANADADADVNGFQPSVQARVRARTSSCPALAVLARLDQCLGTLPEPLVPLRVHPPFRVRHCFDGPVQHPDAIELVTVDLIDRLCRSVRRSERGISRIRWTAERVHGNPLAITFDLGVPTRQRDQLWALLHPHLERLQAEMGGTDGDRAQVARSRRRATRDGRQVRRWRDRIARGDANPQIASMGIDAITLEAPRTVPVPHRQHIGLDSKALLQHTAVTGSITGGVTGGITAQRQTRSPTLDADALACADRLSARLGRHRVLRGMHHGSHEPELAWGRAPWDGTVDRPSGHTAKGSPHAEHMRHMVHLSQAPPAGDRPPWLLEQPHPIRMIGGTLGEQPPFASSHAAAGPERCHTATSSTDTLSFCWSNRLYRVVDIDGWECIDSAWWDSISPASMRSLRQQTHQAHLAHQADTCSTAADTPIPELRATRRWYCRVICADGSVFWMYRIMPIGTDHPAEIVRDRTADTAHPTGHPDQWWLHGGWF